MKILLFFFLHLFFSSAVAGAYLSFDEVRESFVKSDSLLLDRHGEVLQELRMDPVRSRLEWVTLKEISLPLQQAVIQAEDRRFYHHGGVDFIALGRVALQRLSGENLREERGLV